jgi:hypothetical protein
MIKPTTHPSIGRYRFFLVEPAPVINLFAFTWTLTGHRRHAERNPI